MSWGGEYYDEHRSVTDIQSQLPKVMVLMVIVLVAMFGAYRQPIITLMTLPFSLYRHYLEPIAI